MGGIAGAVALFVVAGTFALAIAQRRRETAVLRALGATPRQVRRLIATEAFLLSVVASGLGLLAGGPLARAIVERAGRPRRRAGRLRAGPLLDPARRGARDGHRRRAGRGRRRGAAGRARAPGRGAARGGGRARPARRRAHARRRPLARRRRRDGAAVQRRAGVRVLDPRGDPARDRDRAARALAARPAGRAALAAAAAARRARPAREHRAGGQPLAQRRAGDPDPADRDAGRQPGRAVRELPPRHGVRDRGAGQGGARGRRARRRAAAGRHGRAARAAPGRRRRHGRAADAGVPARQGPDGLGRPVAGRRARRRDAHRRPAASAPATCGT